MSRARLTDAAGEAVEEAVPRRSVGRATIVIAILFGLFYVYELFAAISNVVGVSTQIGQYNAARVAVDLAPVATPWTWLVVDLLLAPVVYTIAFLLARRRTVFGTVLVFLVGLAVVSALTLSVEALA
ncbi:MAG TPA: hypothetical protein VGC18_12935 [Lacisediminihabitans sp.]|uniref:hypothetical protein n=1 Tax=Lacisediminihabitans sp. TaxID=2787631 RepID=UPI002EDAD07A